MKSITLDRLLQSQGLGTRAYCRELIESGEFTIDSQVVNNWNNKIDPSAHCYTLFGEPFEYREFVYIALNKPSGYECSRNPTRHLGVLQLLPETFQWRDVQPVGRLDQDTTGLLLLSDDGQFIHRMSSPKHHVTKVYQATVDQVINEELIELLQSGVQLHDEKTTIAALYAKKIADHELELGLAEGKYHQVKRMIAAAHAHCQALKRVAIGQLHLEALQLLPGHWKHLSLEEIALLSD